MTPEEIEELRFRLIKNSCEFMERFSGETLVRFARTERERIRNILDADENILRAYKISIEQK